MTAPLTFGALLRHHRRACGLTQEELAGRTEHLHPRTISDLERGLRRRPHRGTAAELAAALGLAGEDRAQFLAVARGRGGEPPVAPSAPALPQPLDRFIGREADQAELVRLLFAPAAHRLVTLVGPGGCGKSRLALEVAHAVAGQFPDGVWLAELAGLADPSLAPAALAAASGLRTPAERAALPALIAALGDRRCLLIADNCEHLLAPATTSLAAALDAVLRACPGVQVLATSRCPLGVAGERVARLAPLALPPPGADLAALDAAPASRLYLDRAALAAGFAPTSAQAPAIAAICRRLDGLPLALELAAARAGALGPEELAAQLRGGFQPLARRGGGVPPHPRTPCAALDWSYDRLAPGERALLRRLAVFAGGCTATAAVAVCGDGDDAAVREGLVALVDASLVQPEPRADGTRYRLLETVRAYALEALEEAGEATAIRDRHLGWCAGLVATLAMRQGTPPLDRLDAEQDNLRAALDHGRATDPVVALQLTTDLLPYWLVRRQEEGRARLGDLLAVGDVPAPARAAAFHALGYLTIWRDLTATRDHLATALALAGPDEGLIAATLPPLIFALVLTGERSAAAGRVGEAEALLRHRDDPALRTALTMVRGYLAEQRGALGEAEALLEAALALHGPAGEPFLKCLILVRLGWLRLMRGAPARAEADFATLLALAGEVGSDRYRSQAHGRLGLVAEWRGDLDDARRHYAAGLALAEAADDDFGRALSLGSLGRLLLRAGDLAGAVRALTRALELAVALRDPRFEAEQLRPLGLARWRQGHRTEGARALRACLDIWATVGNPRGLADCLETLALIAAGRDAARSRTWLAAAGLARCQLGVPLPPVERDRRVALGAGVDFAPEVPDQPIGGEPSTLVLAQLADARRWLATWEASLARGVRDDAAQAEGGVGYPLRKWIGQP